MLKASGSLRREEMKRKMKTERTKGGAWSVSRKSERRTEVYEKESRDKKEIMNVKHTVLCKM